MNDQKNYGKKPEGSGEWQLPELPDLSKADLISLDIETCDPTLKTLGPGVRREGYIVGIAVATQDQEWYIPYGHKTGKQYPKEKVLQWAKKELTRQNQPKIGANILYDLDFLYQAGVKVSGPFYDIQSTEHLLDENRRSFSLDSLAYDYLGINKIEQLMIDVCEREGWKGKPQTHLWKMDPKYVGPYGEGDARLTYDIFRLQRPKITADNLDDLWDIEMRLIPFLLNMRQTGVPINIAGLDELIAELRESLRQKVLELEAVAKTHVDFWAAASIAEVFDANKLDYPTTPKTKKPSFTKGWLECHDHPVAKKIVECRSLDKLIGTFLDGSISNMLTQRRLHCQFNPARPVTGRFSSSTPNLQFIPARTEKGMKIRKLFIPDEGYNWGRMDYSQIELRILAHYAMGKGSDELRQRYVDDPTTDLHQWCADKAGISRKFAKTVNFGLVYGMGVGKLSTSLNISKKEAQKFLDDYFDSLPFIKKTVSTAMHVAEKRGYVKTILNRRRRFDFWEPADYNLKWKIPASRDKESILRKIEISRRQGGRPSHGLVRAGCYKAFNAVDQGSAADIMKKAMVDVWESGLCDVIIPYLTVHDEIDFGYPPGKESVLSDLKEIMENTVKLKVPLLVDIETGENWGSLVSYGK